MQNPGKFLIVIGIVIVFVGTLLLFRDSLPFLKQIGRLPGDILIKRKNFTFYFPITTGIVLSILLSLVLYLIGKFR